MAEMDKTVSDDDALMLRLVEAVQQWRAQAMAGRVPSRTTAEAMAKTLGVDEALAARALEALVQRQELSKWSTLPRKGEAMPPALYTPQVVMSMTGARDA